MSGLPATDPRRLGYPSMKPGAMFGHPPYWREVVGPAEELWARLRQLVAQEDHFWDVERPAGSKRSRMDAGKLQGQIEATGEALAIVLLGNNVYHGDAWRTLMQEAREVNRAEAAAKEAAQA